MTADRMIADRRTLLRATARLAVLTAGAGCSPRAAAPPRAGPTRGRSPCTPAPSTRRAGTRPRWTRPGRAARGRPPRTHRLPSADPQPGAVAAAATPSAPPSPPVLPPLPPGTPLEVVYGPRTGKNVALTVHGSGDPKLATALLEIAEQRGAGLTVMAVGSWLDQQPQMARRILDGGHELGNHTQNHQNISAMSPDQARAEIAQCAERLQRLTGSIGRWFRPPPPSTPPRWCASRPRRSATSTCSPSTSTRATTATRARRSSSAGC
ncbi:polysaccharide deacetylase family protein [Kitasatospora aburaviensis]